MEFWLQFLVGYLLSGRNEVILILDRCVGSVKYVYESGFIEIYVG